MSKKTKVLYLDEDENYRKLVLRSLDIDCFELIEIRDIFSLDIEIARGDVDVILTETNFLGHSLHELVTRIRESLPTIPIIVLTKNGSEELIRSAFKLGIEDYIIKNKKYIEKLSEIINEAIFSAKAKYRLEEKLSNFQNIVESISVGVVVLDMEGKVLYANGFALDILGKSSNELIGTNFQYELNDGMMIDVSIENTKYGHVDVEMKCSIGMWNGIPCKIIVISDITERLKEQKQKLILERQLREAHKFEAIGVMALGIAHDFNNILGSILGYSELILLFRENWNKISEYIQNIISSIERAKDLIKQILVVGRQKEEDKSPIILQPVIKETFKMLRASIPTTIEMNLDLPKQEITIMGSAILIQQILMNLCLNAKDAVDEEHGIIKIFVEQDKIKHQVHIMVQDNGRGIDKKIIHKIFDPYFTTKPREKGTGLGLAVVYGIVRELGGEIKVKSEVGKGTTFVVSIPYLEYKEISKYRTKDDFKLPKGRGKIIVVDDEKEIVNIVKTMLEKIGFQVEGFVDSKYALQEIKNSINDFDLLITDISMPQISGITLIKELKRLDFNKPVIVITGILDEEKKRKLSNLNVSRILSKPVKFSSLCEAIFNSLNKH